MILKRFSKRTMFALLLCFAALVGAVGAYAYILSNQSSVELSRIDVSDDFILETDKTVYKRGENVTITLWNNLNREIFVFTVPSLIIEKKNENWETVYNYILPEYFHCGQIGPPVCFSISNNTSFNFTWNQTIVHCNWTTGAVTYEQAPVGQYRVRTLISFRSAPIEFLAPEEFVTVYSNEFTIKE